MTELRDLGASNFARLKNFGATLRDPKNLIRGLARLKKNSATLRNLKKFTRDFGRPKKFVETLGDLKTIIRDFVQLISLSQFCAAEKNKLVFAPK